MKCDFDSVTQLTIVMKCMNIIYMTNNEPRCATYIYCDLCTQLYLLLIYIGYLVYVIANPSGYFYDTIHL